MSDVVPPGEQPAPKKKTSGCLIALAVVGGLFVLGALVVGIGVWRFSKSDAGQAMGGAFKAAMEGAKAPGAKEIGEAHGCQAAVVDGAAFKRMSEAFGEKRGEKIPEKIVACSVRDESTAPTCEAVAETYRKAVGAAAGSFTVIVNLQGGGKKQEICEKAFAP